MLEKTLEETDPDTTDVVVMTAKVLPPGGEGQDEHDRAVLALLREQSAGQPWWLGYLDTGAEDIVFPDAPKVTLYSGWEYVLVAGLFYLVGTALFVWARRENHLPVFTAVEKVLVAVVTATSVLAVIGLFQGFVSV